MSNRYWASVTFPAAAGKIPEIASLMEQPGYEIEDTGDGTIKIIDYQANYGCVDEVTNVLNKHRVPYDHEGRPDSFDEVNCTNYVRWSDLPTRVANVLTIGEDIPTTTTLTDADFEKAKLAKTWLKLYDEGKLDELRTCIMMVAQQYTDIVSLEESEWKMPA